MENFGILTPGDLNFDLSQKMTNYFERIFRELSNAVFRFVLRCAGAEIDGGVQTPPPPAGGGKSRGPAGRGLIVVCTRVARHRILVWSIDLIQHLFWNWFDSTRDSIRFFKKWIDSSCDSSGYEKCDSIRFMIQAKIIWFWFDSWFKSESFTSLLCTDAPASHPPATSQFVIQIKTNNHRFLSNPVLWNGSKGTNYKTAHNLWHVALVVWSTTWSTAHEVLRPVLEYPHQVLPSHPQ